MHAILKCKWSNLFVTYMNKFVFSLILVGLLLFGCASEHTNSINPKYINNKTNSTDNPNSEIAPNNLNGSVIQSNNTSAEGIPTEEKSNQVTVHYRSMINRTYEQLTTDEGWGIKTTIKDFHVISDNSTGVSDVFASLLVENIGKHELLVYCGDFSVIDKLGRIYDLTGNWQLDDIEPGLAKYFNCSQSMPIDAELQTFDAHRTGLPEISDNITK